MPTKNFATCILDIQSRARAKKKKKHRSILFKIAVCNGKRRLGEIKNYLGNTIKMYLNVSIPKELFKILYFDISKTVSNMLGKIEPHDIYKYEYVL